VDTFSLQNIHPHQVEFMHQFEKQAGQVELRAFTARGSAVCFVALCRA